MSRQNIAGARKAYLNVSEAAVFLNKTEAAIYRMVARRQIPFRKLHRRLMFKVSELEQLVERLPGVTLDEIMEQERVGQL
jgi:excisionase family DNA binding protein